MNYSRVYLWVEGTDDERFVEHLVKPLLEAGADFVETVLYAEETKKWMINFLKSIEAMGAEYIFFTDNDQAPCVTARKQKTTERYCEVDEDRVQVVVEEVESWYLAGLDDESSEKLGIPSFSTTDTISKEQFDQLVPKDFDSRIDFMLEIINHFDINIATVKNGSFEYFFNNYAGNVEYPR